MPKAFFALVGVVGVCFLLWGEEPFPLVSSDPPMMVYRVMWVSSTGDIGHDDWDMSADHVREGLDYMLRTYPGYYYCIETREFPLRTNSDKEK